MLHNLAIHPNKCLLFARELIYCVLHVSGDGVTVDPGRLQSLLEMPEPVRVGDVRKFKAAVGRIRPDVPLIAIVEDAPNQFVTRALKYCKRKDMRAADKITIEAAGWSQQHLSAWKHIK